MNISHEDLRQAASSEGMTPEQADLLWIRLGSRSADSAKPRFDLVNVAYYLGALIVIGAMGWFMNKAWDRMGGPGLAAIASAYAVFFAAVGKKLWDRPMKVPAGLLFTIAVCMVPLAVFGTERWTGYWPATDPGSYSSFHPNINGSWVIMEAATIAAGCIALRFWRFPFLTAPIAYALWYMSMDLAELIVGHPLTGTREKDAISMAFGTVVLLISYLVDLRGKSDDFAFWGYLFGLMAFWGGLSMMDSDTELGKVVYCIINIGLIACSLVLRRRVFIIFGASGLFGYLGHLAYQVFENSILFPFVLTVIGVLVMSLGVLYQKKRAHIELFLQRSVLSRVSTFIPERALKDQA